ncbi:alpha/beta fold hydrolase [Streptomyces marincola]|nr:alpha/beta hydrolase [Streptomyces marincola]
MKPAVAVASSILNTTALLPGRAAGRGAFALFHMPLVRSRLRTAERELFEQARVDRIRLGSGRHAVAYRWGDGDRPALLAHGWQSRASRLSCFVPGLLERGHSVVAFDAPGHGEADGRSTTILDYRDIVLALNDRYGTFDCLIAHSLGALGSFLGLRHGARARRIVTIGGVCDFDYLIDEFCAEVGAGDRLRSRLREEVRTRLFPGLPADETPFSLTDMPAHVPAPLLVVHDEDDTRIRIAQGRRLAAAFGDRARLVVTRGLGHRRVLGDADVLRTVLDFVDNAPGRADGTDRRATAAG